VEVFAVRFPAGSYESAKEARVTTGLEPVLVIVWEASLPVEGS
jgi:hypothetical protein